MAGKSINQPRLGVGVFVIKKGKFLMGMRKGSHGTGMWSVPGGWLEYGETLEAAAAREVKEETGMRISAVSFHTLTNNIFQDEDIHSLTAWMTSGWVSGDPTILEPDKFIDQRWFDLDTLPSPLFLPWDDFLKNAEAVAELGQRLKDSKA
jgi:8-oxo-dGTP diphosphatase